MEFTQEMMVLILTVFVVGMKLLDFVVKWALNKVQGKKDEGVQFGAEHARQLAEVLRALLELEKRKEWVEADHQKLRELHILHNRMDSDGVPLFYFPRSMLVAMKEVADQLDKIAECQKDTLRVLEGQMKMYDTMVDRMHTFTTQLGNRIVSPPSVTPGGSSKPDDH